MPSGNALPQRLMPTMFSKSGLTIKMEVSDPQSTSKRDNEGRMHSALHRVSVVIPVYQGETTLPQLVREIASLADEQVTEHGNRFVVGELVLVHDCGPDRSAETIRQLAEIFPFVRAVWLSRNFGQHPATLAGMASAVGDWVVTLDEDGQHNPADIAGMVDKAFEAGLQLVYAEPLNPPPHGAMRNAASRLAKVMAGKLLGGEANVRFNSFRLVDGEIARTLAAYCGNGVYLDVGLSWIAGRVGYSPVNLRSEVRPSGYSLVKLLAHFWRLVFTTGTRPLRLITLSGFFSLGVAMAISAYAIWGKISTNSQVQGWASLVIVVAFFSGAMLTALGVIAEYMAVTTGIAMGKPLYVVSSKPSPRPNSR